MDAGVATTEAEHNEVLNGGGSAGIDRHFSLHQVALIHRTQQTMTTDWLTRLLVRSNRLVLGVPL